MSECHCVRVVLGARDRARIRNPWRELSGFLTKLSEECACRPSYSDSVSCHVVINNVVAVASHGVTVGIPNKKLVITRVSL